MQDALTEAEQNRLILENIGLVASISSDLRGKKGIPFEDLEAEGMAALVQAARTWGRLAKFSTYATKVIKTSLWRFINEWQDLDAIGELNADDGERIYEWDMWGILPSEGWTRLPATPLEMLEMWEELNARATSLSAAFVELSPHELKVVMQKHGLKRDKDRAIVPGAIPKSYTDIAHYHGRSYFDVVNTMNAALRKMRDVVRNSELKRAAA